MPRLERRGSAEWWLRRSLTWRGGGFAGVLGRSTTSGGQLPDMIEEDGALQGIELGGIGRNLSEERIGHEDRCLVAMAGIGVAEQSRDVHLQGASQAIQGREGWHCFAVLDLGDIGARNIHTGCELPLGQVSDVAEIANSGCDLDTALLLGRRWDESQRCWCRCGFLNFEGLVAAPAE
jgi:hypothetical protein